MGSVLAGLGGGGGVQAPNLYQPFTAGQIDQSYQNTQNSIQQQQALLQALQQQGGPQNQSQVYNQLQQVAAGQGPNPAQAMLNNATGANVANQAALAAGQRGASANAGLIARQAAQAGANAQQQAAGQGAALQAQQGLNALNAAGNIAGQQVGSQLQGNQLLANTALQGQQNLLGAAGNYNSAQNQNYVAQTQNQQNQAQQGGGALGGLLNAAGPVIKTALPVIGGIFGGPVGAAAGGALSNSMNTTRPGADTLQAFAEGGTVATPKSHFGRYAHGGKVDALTAPGERYLPPSEVKAVAEGHKAPMQAGSVIPGKPKVSGAVDDYRNDTVRKKLEVGGIVLPNSITKSKDADKKSREFVAAILSRKRHK